MNTQIPDRLLRFVLHTTMDVEEKKLFECVELALGEIAFKHMPDLLRVDKSFWDHHAKTGRRIDHFNYRKKTITEQREPYLVDNISLNKRCDLVKNGESAGLPIKLDPFIAGEKKRTPKLAPKLGRHQFFILTLPYYEGTFRRRQCKPNGVLFDIGYELREKCRLASVVPDLQYPHYQLFSSSSSSSSNSSDCETDNQWHLNNINYNDVPTNIDGTGIRIGHPDTGWTRHPQLNFAADGSNPNYDFSADVNIINPNSTSAEEAVPTTKAPMTNPYHGTATGGLFISYPDDEVNGLAPGATIVSIRAIDSVILIGDINVAQAIIAAVDADAHVISMSLGGYPAPLLEWAINYAVSNNVIVIAAAGNVVPNVVYPAAYPACIAVGGSTIEDTVWEGSARDLTGSGQVIDISAPSECVHVPNWDGETHVSGAYSGTSFGTAIVAGAAALWLQRFNRNTLINALSGRSTLQELFRAHLRLTARRPADWNVFLDGPGILNLRGLMAQRRLPNPRRFLFPPIIDDIGINNILDFMPPPWVEIVFGDEAKDIFDQVGEEIETLIMSNPVLASLALALGETSEAIEEATEAVANAVGAAADAAEEFVEEVVEEAEELVEEFIDTATDTTSDFLNDVAGWF